MAEIIRTAKEIEDAAVVFQHAREVGEQDMNLYSTDQHDQIRGDLRFFDGMVAALKFVLGEEQENVIEAYIKGNQLAQRIGVSSLPDLLSPRWKEGQKIIQKE